MKELRDFLLIENLGWHPIPITESTNLCPLFQEDEVKTMIHSFEKNKAPGLDEFPLLFYKKF